MSNPFNVADIRKDFPILDQTVNGHELAYFDNAATTQKPTQVIDAISHYYQNDNSNVHRGVHALSARATDCYEAARKKVGRFINAPSVSECIFVRGTTEAINLVANAYVLPMLKAGDEVVITHMEHHSNIVPWQMVCKQAGATLQVVPLSQSGELLLDEFAKKLSHKTKFVAIGYASNALGTINPVKTMTEMAHACGAKVLIDGAQAAPHLAIDVQDLGCDFFAFSGHKMYAPTGIGVLWGKAELLNDMAPYQGGGEMILYVSFNQTEYAPIPNKFEAGTPHIAGAIGLGAAIDYLGSLDFNAVLDYELKLLRYATNALQSQTGYRIIGNAADKVPVLSFVHDKIHAHDIGTILDSKGVAVRSGHHCAMPVMDFYKVPATSRMSMSFYNTVEEVDRCIEALAYVTEVFA